MRSWTCTLLALALLAGCGQGSDPNGPSDSYPQGDYLIVDPPVMLLAVDSSFTMNWQVYAAGGQLAGKPPMNWVSNNTSVATVDSDGTVHVVGVGQATIHGAAKNLQADRSVFGVAGGTLLGRATGVGTAVTPPWRVGVHGDDAYVMLAAGAGLFHGSVTSRTVEALPLHGGSHDFLLSVAGDTAWLAAGGGITEIVLPTGDSIATSGPVLSGGVYSLARSDDGNTFFAAGELGEIASLKADLTTNAVWHTQAGDVVALQYDGPRNRLYAAVNAGILSLTLANDTIIGSEMLLDSTFVNDVKLSADGSILYVASQTTDGLIVLDLATGQSTVVPTLGQPLGLALTPDGHFLVVATPDWGGRVDLFDTQAQAFVKTWHVGGQPAHVAIRSDGTILVANTNDWVDFVQ